MVELEPADRAVPQVPGDGGRGVERHQVAGDARDSGHATEETHAIEVPPRTPKLPTSSRNIASTSGWKPEPPHDRQPECVQHQREGYP